VDDGKEDDKAADKVQDKKEEGEEARAPLAKEAVGTAKVLAKHKDRDEKADHEGREMGRKVDVSVEGRNALDHRDAHERRAQEAVCEELLRVESMKRHDQLRSVRPEKRHERGPSAASDRVGLDDAAEENPPDVTEKVDAHEAIPTPRSFEIEAHPHLAVEVDDDLDQTAVQKDGRKKSL